MAEGTGLEPYSPCQGLVRGQGGLEDVQACVDLPVHLPVAHQTHEHLAHPISAPGATHWAGLTGPRGVHFDDWHTFEGGFVLDLTMDHRTRPGGKAAIHPTGAAACAVECEASRTIAARRLSANCTSRFEIRCSRCRIQCRSRCPSPFNKRRMTPRSPAFFLASLLRRRKWVSWTVRTPSKGRAVGTIRSPDATTPSRESSFVSRAIAASGS